MHPSLIFQQLPVCPKQLNHLDFAYVYEASDLIVNFPNYLEDCLQIRQKVLQNNLLLEQTLAFLKVMKMD